MLLLEHSCDIQRNQAVGTNGRKAMSTVATLIPCLFLPMSPAAAVQNGFSVSKAYDAYFSAGQDVKVGDKLLSSGRSYLVKGVQDFNTAYAGHVHVLCEQEAT